MVSCNQPHDAEVFGTFPLAGHRYPGAAAVQQQADQGCAARLSGYLNPQLSLSSLTESYVYPDAGAWAAGERTVVCTVRSASGQLTGSVRDASGLTAGQAARAGRSILSVPAGSMEDMSAPPGRDPMEGFSAVTRDWFTAAFAAPTEAQVQAWAAIGKGENTLVIAPTGLRQDAGRVPLGAGPAGRSHQPLPMPNASAGCCTSRRSRRLRWTSSATCAPR